MKFFGYLLLGMAASDAGAASTSSTSATTGATTTVATTSTYVLRADKWGEVQVKAAIEAGGNILWKHEGAGIAAVESNNPDFAEEALDLEVFSSVDKDLEASWVNPPNGYVTDGEDDAQPANSSAHIVPEEALLYQAYQWNMRAIGAPKAWAADCTGKGVRIAIIDGGIDPNHPDLGPNMDASCSKSFVPGKLFDEDDPDRLWHGMHVAGIAAGANGGGVIGVAPEATIIGVKALDSGSGYFAWIIGSILYASDPAAFGRPDCKKADVINMSLGATFPKRLAGAGPLIGALNWAVNYAGSKGVLVVSAAGNDGLDLGQAQDTTTVPAESGSGLAIAATGIEDLPGAAKEVGDPTALASYSNYGEGTIDLAAPGGDLATLALVHVNSPRAIAGAKTAGYAIFTPPPSGETGDVVLWTDAIDDSGDQHDACEVGADPSVAGKIALIHRGNCTFVTKVQNAYASDAIAVIISNNIAGSPPLLSGSEYVPIPAVSIEQVDGADIEAELESGNDVSATLVFNPSAFDSLIASAHRASDGTPRWALAMGTSMAAPMVAGVAALIKGQDPGMSLGKLKTELLRATDDVGPREKYGHGFVNAAKACGVIACKSFSKKKPCQKNGCEWDEGICAPSVDASIFKFSYADKIEEAVVKEQSSGSTVAAIYSPLVCVSAMMFYWFDW